MSLIKTKFIQDNAVNDLKIRLRNNLALRARNAANTADVEILKINTSDILEILRTMDMGNLQIKNLADPTDPKDAVNKQFVETLVAGLSDPKDAVRAATTAALAASTYDNGVDGVGATITADANGALAAIDGIGLSVDDRLLVKDQAAGLENGIYVVTQLGDAGTPWILTRSDDADNSGDQSSIVSQGMFVPVAEGTVNGALGFLLTTPNPIVIGTTTLTFTQFGEVIVAGQGLTKSGTTLSVDAGDGLGFSGNQLVVIADDDLVDGTTKIVTGVLVGRRRAKEDFTLTTTDITNGYVDLAKIASRDSIILQPDGGPKQNESLDYTVSYLGGAGGKTRVTFAGDLASGGSSALAANDKLYLNYETLDF